MLTHPWPWERFGCLQSFSFGASPSRYRVKSRIRRGAPPPMPQPHSPQKFPSASSQRCGHVAQVACLASCVGLSMVPRAIALATDAALPSVALARAQGDFCRGIVGESSGTYTIGSSFVFLFPISYCSVVSGILERSIVITSIYRWRCVSDPVERYRLASPR